MGDVRRELPGFRQLRDALHLLLHLDLFGDILEDNHDAQRVPRLTAKLGGA